MMTFEKKTMRYGLLLEWGLLTPEQLKLAGESATARGLDLETVLARDLKVPKHAVLQALADHYQRPFVEYDEKMPIPPDLLAAVDNERLTFSSWFPILRDKGTIVLIANDPVDVTVLIEAGRAFPKARFEVWVALREDIQWYIQDYLHARPGQLIGTERTGLAFWRNTMAQWRTRLACYRTDLAQARTHLALLRWGLGFVALADGLMRTNGAPGAPPLSYALLSGGILCVLAGMRGYSRVRRERMRPPGHHTLVEVTAATTTFLEQYHDIEGADRVPLKKTMLARMGDMLGNHSTYLFPQPASKERTQLARERNVLAAQRTIAAAYRTVYARGRTGLAFIRSGAAFVVLGLGLIRYFSISAFTAIDACLVVAGLFMIVDGARWYLPVRRELSEAPRCPLPEAAAS